MNMNYYCDYYIDSDPLYYCTAFSSDHIPTLFLVNAEIFFSFDFHHNFSSVFLPLNFFLFLPLLKPITHLLHLPHLKYHSVTYSIIFLFFYLLLLLLMSQNMGGQVLQPFPVDMDVNITWIEDIHIPFCRYSHLSIIFSNLSPLGCYRTGIL